MSKDLQSPQGNLVPDGDLANASLAFSDSGVVRVSARVRPLVPPPVQTPPKPAFSTPPIPPRIIAQVDHTTLLTVATLTLSKELRFSAAHVGRIVVRYPPDRRHLVMTPLQWTVLRCFHDGRTVPGVLKHLIHHSGCIPLCEFYELILKACEYGILQTPGYPLPATVTPAPWKFTLSSRIVRPAAGCLILSSILLLVVNPVQAPTHLLWWLPGWLLLCGATSAGAALAAGVIHGADGDLYHPRFIFRSLFPRFMVEHEEALLAGRQVEIDLALAQLVPFATLATLAANWAPSLALPLFCGLLWNLAPLGNNPGLRLLRALHHSPRLSTSRHFRFKPNQTLLHRLRQRLDPGEIRFLSLRAGYAIPWLLLVVLTWAATTRLDVAAIWHDALGHGLAKIAGWTAAGLLGLALICGLTLGVAIAAQTRRARRGALRDHEARELATLTRPVPTTEDIVRFFGETHPLHQLPVSRRQLLAEATRQTPFTAGETVLAAGDTRTRFYLLYSGSVNVAAHGRQPTTHLTAGCILGESVLLNGGAQPANVRGVVPGILLSFNREIYDEQVAPLIPRHKIEDAVQKITFLRQIALSRHWSTHLLDGFARRAVAHTFTYNAVILEQGRENLWFYVLQKGELRVLRDGKRIARLRPGDFFGEVSLLQNSLTTAEVVCHVPGTYLAIPRQDFLLFLTQDHQLAMQFEAIASRRLGRPLFPL